MGTASSFSRAMRFRAAAFVCAAGFLAPSPLSAAKFTGEPEIQAQPLSPEESLRRMRVEDGLRIELVAAEPLIVDPADIAFDERGRMYVAEISGYNRPEGARPRSRIRMLHDDDGDGRMDRGTTFANDLDYAQGVLPVRDGLLVTTNTGILFLRDDNNDGRADTREVLLECTPSINVDRQMSAPRHGIDNWIHINLGLFKKDLFPPGAPGRKLSLATNLRYHPKTGRFEASSGAGQFGKAFDDWGHEFFSMNRNPGLFAVLPRRYLERNPFAFLTKGDDDVIPAGGEGKVYPIQNFRTTSSAHAGTFTAACGTGVYRGDLLGSDYVGNLFVCEPTGALVSRWILAPSGSSFRARRAHPAREFLASSDEWFRPVNTTTGPDGALYIVDMYRRFIDGARFFPDAYRTKNDMGSGSERGRIYRIVPDTAARHRRVAALTGKPAERVALLEHPNGWHRDTAQRLLVEAGDPQVLSAVEDILRRSRLAQGRLHALWTIEGLDRLEARHVTAALADSEPGVVENGLWLAPRFVRTDDTVREQVRVLTSDSNSRLRFAALLALGDLEPEQAAAALARAAVRDADDVWMRTAIMSSPATHSGAVLAGLLRDPAFRTDSTRGRIELVNGLAMILAARGNAAGLQPVLVQFDDPKIASGGNWWQIAVVSGIAEGLRRQTAESLPRSIAALIADPPPELADRLRGIQRVIASADAILRDRTRPVGERVAAVSLLEHLPKQEAGILISSLLNSREPVEIQKAVLDLVPRLDRATVTSILYERLGEMGSVARTSAMQFLQRNPMELLRRIKAGRLNPALVDAATRWGILNSNSDEVRSLGREIFGATASDRKALVQRYAASIKDQAVSASRGHVVFSQTCAVCHRFRGEGNELGPDISDVRIKTPEMLLSDILDPNNAVEPQWEAYSVRMRDGRTVVGIIASESNEALVVRTIGGSETISRATLATCEPLGTSLMPQGLEATLTDTRMADLLAYLRSAATPNGARAASSR